MPPIDGLDSVRSLEQPRRDDLEAGAARAWSSSAAARSASELAQAWSTLGTDGHPGRGRGAPAAARGAVRRRAGRRRRCATPTGSTCAPASSPSGIARADDGVAVELSDGSRVEAEEILVAVGRKPRTEEHRPGVGRDRAGRARLPRDRRPTAGRRPRLALRGRRRQRPGAVHPHGQVPGLGRRRERARPRGRGRSPKASARPGSPSPTPRSPPSARRSRRPKRPGSTLGPSTSPTDGTAGASFYGKGTGGTSRLVIDETRESDRRRHLHRLRDRRLPPRRDHRYRRRSSARAPTPRRRRLPHPQRDLAEAARGLRPLEPSVGVERLVLPERRLGRQSCLGKLRDPCGGRFRSSTRASCWERRRPGRARRPTGSGRPARGGRAGGWPG